MKVILRLMFQSRELARVWISNLHSVKLRVEAMQVELSMITNTYSNGVGSNNDGLGDTEKGLH